MGADYVKFHSCNVTEWMKYKLLPSDRYLLFLGLMPSNLNLTDNEWFLATDRHILSKDLSSNVILVIAPSDVLIMTQLVCSQFGDECKECCYKSHYTHHTKGKGILLHLS